MPKPRTHSGRLLAGDQKTGLGQGRDGYAHTRESEYVGILVQCRGKEVTAGEKFYPPAKSPTEMQITTNPTDALQVLHHPPPRQLISLTGQLTQQAFL